MVKDFRTIEENLKLKRLIRFPVLFVLLLAILPLSGQQANTLYLMHAVPQTNLLNPAVQLRCKYFVGLPVLGTTHLNYSNSSFSYNDIADGNQLLLDNVYNQLYRMNMLSLDLKTYPLYLGYREGVHYFTFSVAERFVSDNSYSRKLAGMLLYGNTQYIGETARFNNNRINGTWYREYGAGWSMEYDRFITLGMRAKLLFGKASLNTGSSRLRLGTDVETFALSIKGDMTFNSSFPMTVIQNSAGAITSIELPEINYWSLVMNPRNVGIATDLGVIFRYTDDVTFSASLLDLGVIFWTDELYNINAEVDFLYEGVGEGTDFSAAAYFRDLSDSIAGDIIYDVTQKPYLTPLPTQLFLGASYRYSEHVSLGAVMRSVLVNRRISSSLTTLVNVSLFDRLEATLSWSYLNNTAANVGVGLAYTGRGMQFYAVTDNFLGFIRPLDTRTVNFRIGMNLMLGCPVNFNRNQGEGRSMVPCPPGALKKFRK